MDYQPPAIYEENTFKGLDQFQSHLKSRKCRYYASDFLNATDKNLAMVEVSVLHALEVFKTLDLPAEEHFYEVFRCTPNHIIYKDWRISDLACAYMLVNGDPADLKSIAVQQTALIDQILQHIHPDLIMRPK